MEIILGKVRADRSDWSIKLEDIYGITWKTKTQGIYCIKDKSTDEVLYVGSSTDLYSRCSNYFGCLSSDDVHYATTWVHAHKDGCYFCVIGTVIKEISIKRLRELEELVTDYYKSIGQAPLNISSGDRQADSTKQKRSIVMSGQNNGMYGRNGEEHPRARRVLCVETGQVFGCAKDAGIWAGSESKNPGTTVRECCKGRLKNALGYHWEYV